MSKRLGGLALAAAFVTSACEEAPPPRGTAITNVTVIDAASGERAGQTVVFDGDAILAVAPADGDLPPVERTIDGEGRYLIPGLWDMHVHLVYDARLTDAMPDLFLSHGITSVRDTGGLLEEIVPVVERMRAPEARSPRVFFAGPLLDGEFVVYDGMGRPEIGRQNADVEMARASVADLRAAGVDFLKIYEMVSPEVFDALVASAEEAGLPIAAHVPLSMLARVAGPRVDSMEHLRNVELDCAASAEDLHEARVEILESHTVGPGADLRTRLHALQRERAIEDYDEARCRETIESLTSTIQVPTLRLNTLGMHPPFERADWEAGLANLPQEVRDEWNASVAGFRESAFGRDTTFAEWALSLVGSMHAAGVPIGAGTDTPIAFSIPGYSLHTELERLVDAGLTPLEALGAATLRPAEFLGLENEMGAIAVGQRADLVLLDESPLEDIANTRTVSVVVSKGVVVFE